MSDRRIVSVSSVNKNIEKAEWLPYAGPRGGTGWRSTETGDVTYEDKPPGETVSPKQALDEIGAGSAHIEGLMDGLEVAEESDYVTREEMSQKVVGELVNRNVGDSDMDLNAIGRENIENFTETMIEGEIEDAREYDSMPSWGQAMSNYGDGMESNKLTSNMREVIEDNAEDIPVTVGEFEEMVEDNFDKEEVMSQFRDTLDPQDRSADMARAMIAAGVQEAIDDALGDVTDEIDAAEMLDADRYESETAFERTKISFSDAASEEFDRWSDEGEAISQIAADPDIDGFDESVERFLDETTDTPDERMNMISRLKDGMQSVYKPIESRELPDDIDPTFDPRNADEIISLGNSSDVDGGRSASSMMIAKGVADEDGNERDIFVTNTNRNKGPAENEKDGERCVAGSNGFAEAGIPVADYINVPGEFWACEEVGTAVDDAVKKEGVTIDDLDAPFSQAVEHLAVGCVLGATDLHNGNVAVSDGDLVPFDFDLVGAEVHDGADPFENKFRFGQNSVLQRGLRLFNDSEPKFGEPEAFVCDDVDGFSEDDLRDAIKLRSKQLAEDGTLRDAAQAAIDSSNNKQIERHITENILAFERDDFWGDDIANVDGGLPEVMDRATQLEHNAEMVEAGETAEVTPLQETTAAEVASMDDEEIVSAAVDEPEEEPFTNFRECVEYHDDKRDPDSYCAVVFGFDNQDLPEDLEDEDEDEYDTEEVLGDVLDEISMQF